MRRNVSNTTGFSNEPKQIRPGEDVQMKDGRVQVSGQVAVMGHQRTITPDPAAKIPTSPLRSANLSRSSPSTAKPPRSAPSLNSAPPTPPTRSRPNTPRNPLDYWRSTTQTLLANPEAAASSTAREAYTKLILGQVGLFVDRKLPAEAEQAL